MSQAGLQTENQGRLTVWEYKGSANSGLQDEPDRKHGTGDRLRRGRQGIVSVRIS